MKKYCIYKVSFAPPRISGDRYPESLNPIRTCVGASSRLRLDGQAARVFLDYSIGHVACLHLCSAILQILSVSDLG